MDLQDLLRIGQDWWRTLGVGGVIVAIIGWSIRRRFEKRDKAEERGRVLVAAAQPDLTATTNVGTHKQVALVVENIGRDVAHTLWIGFTGIPDVEARVVVPAGQKKDVATLDASGSPFFTAGDSDAEITLTYADRHGNEFRLKIPVTPRRRADGEFTMVIDWQRQRTVPPMLTKKRLREIGV